MIDWKRVDCGLPPIHQPVLVYLPEAYAERFEGEYGDRSYVGVGELNDFGWHVAWWQTGAETFDFDAVTHWADITLPEDD